MRTLSEPLWRVSPHFCAQPSSTGPVCLGVAAISECITAVSLLPLGTISVEGTLKWSLGAALWALGYRGKTIPPPPHPTTGTWRSTWLRFGFPPVLPAPTEPQVGGHKRQGKVAFARKCHEPSFFFFCLFCLFLGHSCSIWGFLGGG